MAKIHRQTTQDTSLQVRGGRREPRKEWNIKEMQHKRAVALSWNFSCYWPSKANSHQQEIKAANWFKMSPNGTNHVCSSFPNAQGTYTTTTFLQLRQEDISMQRVSVTGQELSRVVSLLHKCVRGVSILWGAGTGVGVVGGCGNGREDGRGSRSCIKHEKVHWNNLKAKRHGKQKWGQLTVWTVAKTTVPSLSDSSQGSFTALAPLATALWNTYVHTHTRQHINYSLSKQKCIKHHYRLCYLLNRNLLTH